jgi:hypothetical protein
MCASRSTAPIFPFGSRAENTSESPEFTLVSKPLPRRPLHPDSETPQEILTLLRSIDGRLDEVATHCTNSTKNVKLLFDDENFTRSRKYFWAIGCLNEIELTIADNIEQWDFITQLESSLCLTMKTLQLVGCCLIGQRSRPSTRFKP